MISQMANTRAGSLLKMQAYVFKDTLIFISHTLFSDGKLLKSDSCLKSTT